MKQCKIGLEVTCVEVLALRSMLCLGRRPSVHWTFMACGLVKVNLASTRFGLGHEAVRGTRPSGAQDRLGHEAVRTSLEATGSSLVSVGISAYGQG